MTGRGRRVGVWGLLLVVTMMVVCCGLVNGSLPKPRKRVQRPEPPNVRKRVQRPAPKRRVKTIVAELEKNVSALWTRVDLLSQPVHVHVHGDSHPIPHPHQHHHHYHQHHHDNNDDNNDQPCPSQGDDGRSDLMRSSVKPKMERSGGHVSGKRDDEHDGVSARECRRRCVLMHRYAAELIRQGEEDAVRSKYDDDDDDNDDVKYAHECLRRCRLLPDQSSSPPINDSPRHQPHAQQPRSLHHPGPSREREPHPHHNHPSQHRNMHREAEKEADMGPGAVHSGPRGTHVHIHLHTGDLPQPRPLPRQDLPPEPAKEYRYACCVLSPGRPAPNVKGTIMFRQMPGEPVEVKVDLSGMPIDMAQDHSLRYLRGMHGHEYGDVTDHCSLQGGHYNPHDVNHGGPSAAVRHPADFGNLVVGRDGGVVASFNDSRASLFGHFSLLGRGVVIHEGADDLGLRDTAASRKSGDAGARAACCAVLACPAPKGVWDA